MRSSGVRTDRRFEGSRTPDILPGLVPIAILSGGKVNAIIRGSIVCIEKYVGKIADCNVENCARGKALYAVVPPMKLWNNWVPSKEP